MGKSNYERAVRFETPDYIPMSMHINAACYHHYPQEQLFDIMEAHKLLFPNFVRPKKLPYVPYYPAVARRNEPYTDDFGCVWSTTDDGITGTVTGHPLDSWDKWDAYTFPDPEKCMGIGPVDWDAAKRSVDEAKARGDLVMRGLRHGHTFLQLSDIRGYQNLLFDMCDDEPRLMELIEGVEAFNTHIIRRYADMGVDVLTYAEDLGMQVGPMLSPDMFRKYIKPTYQRMMDVARSQGILVHMHSDGDIRALADDLIDGGVEIINLQDLVNGIDWIRDRYAGRVCIDLDIDRQSITPYGTPAQIDALIREEVLKLGSKRGGLTMIYGLYPGVPLENFAALCDAMEKYAFYFS